MSVSLLANALIGNETIEEFNANGRLKVFLNPFFSLMNEV